MNMKKILALLTAVCLMLAVLTGCGSGTQVVEYTETEMEEMTESTQAAAAETASEAAAQSVGQGGTGASFADLDTVVATVNGDDITWEEYYYWLSYYVSYVTALASSYGFTITDWTANDLSATATNAEAVIAEAQYAAVQYHIYEQEAAAQGLTVDDAVNAEIDETVALNADTYYGDGDGTATDEEMAILEDALAETGVTMDLVRYQTAVSILNAESFTAQYGEDGADYPDEDVAAFVADNGLLNAKHIMLMTIDADTGEALDDETIAEKEALAEDLLAQLQAVEGDTEALNALFDELMNTYSEDTGLAAYPNGYIFTEGEMVEAFETAVEGLDENYGLSGIVESEYGYHIILRMPLTPEDLYTNSSGVSYTLRDVAASNDFTARLSALQEEADIQWGENFQTVDLVTIFG